MFLPLTFPSIIYMFSGDPDYEPPPDVTGVEGAHPMARGMIHLFNAMHLMQSDGEAIGPHYPGCVRLAYPPFFPEWTVTLCGPLFGNMEELEQTRIQRETRRGKRITYRDQDWTKGTTFRMQFDSLSLQQRTDMQNFVDLSLGKPIQLDDHEVRTWIGLITNPNGQYTEVNRLCGHTVEFDFRVLSYVDN